MLAWLVVVQLGGAADSARPYAGPLTVEARDEPPSPPQVPTPPVATPRITPAAPPVDDDTGPSAATLGKIYTALAVGFGTLGIGVAAWRGGIYASCPSTRTVDECDYSDGFLLDSLRVFANLHAFAFASAASGVYGRDAADARRTRRRLMIAGATALAGGVALEAGAFALGFANLDIDDLRIAKRRWAGQVALAEIGAVSAIAGGALLARGIAQTENRPQSAGGIYSGFALVFAAAGIGIAGYRGHLYRQCPSYRSPSDCDFGDGFLLAMQAAANLHALAFAGAASAMYGRRTHDSRRVQTRLAIGGAASLAVGVVLGIGGNTLALLQPGKLTHQQWGQVGVALSELGGTAAIAGTVLLARVVAQRRVHRERVALSFSPMRGGASASLRGRF